MWHTYNTVTKVFPSMPPKPSYASGPSSASSAYPGGFKQYMSVKTAKVRAQLSGGSSTVHGKGSSPHHHLIKKPCPSTPSEHSLTLPPQQQQQQQLQEFTDPLFRNTTLYIDGYTGDDDDASWTLHSLKRACFAAGALVVDWYSHGKVHFVIATTMTDRKLDLWKRPIVKPQWLFDSFKARKRLPYFPYLLVPIADPHQSRLSFGHTAPSTNTNHPIQGQIISTEDKSSELAEPSSDQESLSSNPSSDDESLLEEDLTRETSPSKIQRPPGITTLDWSSKWVRENCSIAPGFIDKYFASSRLHHISMWKSKLGSYVETLRQEKAQSQIKKNSMSSSAGNFESLYFHADLDCFFASATLLDYPHLVSAPVAIAHSVSQDSLGAHSSTTWSTSEIASCNYMARQFGIRNGMSLGRAKALCGDLHVLPYVFDRYERCSKAFFRVLVEAADEIQVVSVDEAYLQIRIPCPSAPAGAKSESKDLDEAARIIASQIRAQIYADCGIHASIGIASSLLLARLATRKAKPNGLVYVPASQASEFLGPIKIKDLPGVGYQMQAKLEDLGYHTCAQLRDTPSATLPFLRSILGKKNGEMVYDYVRGVDSRKLISKERASFSIEINWGVRFERDDQVVRFVEELAVKAQERFVDLWGGMVEDDIAKDGKSHAPFTLKFKMKRRLYEGEPPHKVLGCGHCENLSKSMPIKSKDEIVTGCLQLLHDISMDPDFIRGIGIHMVRGGTVTFKNNNVRNSLPKGQRTLDFRKAVLANIRGEPLAQASPPKLAGKETATIQDADDNDDIICISSDSESAISESLTPRPRKQPSPRDIEIPTSQRVVTVGGIEYDVNVVKSMLHFLPPDIQAELAPLLPPDEPSTTTSTPAKRKAESIEPSSDSIVVIHEDTSPCQPMAYPSSSQIDPDIFRALPPSVRKEINLVNRVKRVFKPRRVEGVAPPPFSLHTRVNPPFTRPDLEGAIHTIELARILDTWIQGDVEPSQTRKIHDFVDACICGKDLERTRIFLVLFQHRVRGPTVSPAWVACYNTVMQSVQRQIRQTYGGELDGFNILSFIH